MKFFPSPAVEHRPARRHPGPSVWISGIGTAVPPAATSQKDALRFILSRFNIGERTKQLYKKTLSNKSIAKRHFSLNGLDQVLESDLDRKNARFEREAA